MRWKDLQPGDVTVNGFTKDSYLLISKEPSVETWMNLCGSGAVLSVPAVNYDHDMIVGPHMTVLRGGVVIQEGIVEGP